MEVPAERDNSSHSLFCNEHSKKWFLHYERKRGCSKGVEISRKSSSQVLQRQIFTRHILNMLKCSFKDQVVNSSQPIIFQPKSKSDILKEAHKEKEEIAAVEKFQDLVDLYTKWVPCQEISAATLIQDAALWLCWFWATHSTFLSQGGDSEVYLYLLLF